MRKITVCFGIGFVLYALAANADVPTLGNAQVTQMYQATASCMRRQVIVADDPRTPIPDEGMVIANYCFSQDMKRSTACDDACWSREGADAVNYIEAFILHWRAMNSPSY